MHTHSSSLGKAMARETFMYTVLSFPLKKKKKKNQDTLSVELSPDFTSTVRWQMPKRNLLCEAKLLTVESYPRGMTNG